MKEDEKTEPKLILKNSFFTFLTNFSLYFYALITSFLLARQITQEVWGFLILATAYITITVAILNFVPPGLNASVIFFIPRYKALNQMNMLKSFLIKALFLKLVAVLGSFILFTLTINLFSNVFTFNLDGYNSLINILSSLIIIQSMGSFFFAFKIGFNLFKLNLILKLITYITNIMGYLIYFIFFENIQIEVIALINLLSPILPFVLDCIIFTFKLSKIEDTGEAKLGYKETFKKVINYGFYSSTSTVANQIWNPIQIQSIGVYVDSQWVTGFNIGNHYSEISKIFSTSLNFPLGVSFTKLYSKGEFEQVGKISKHIVSYVIFIVSIIVGILFFLTDFFIFIIYGGNYLIFSVTIKLLILSMGYGNISSLFNSLAHVTFRVKLVPLLVLTVYTVKIPLFLIGLIYFGINGGIIGMIIGNVISLFLSYLLTHKIFKIKLNILKISMQYLIFYCSLGLAILLGEFILNPFNLKIYQSLNLTFFNHLPLLTLGSFLLIFLGLNSVFKIITKKDADYLELLFTKDNFTHKLIRRLTKFIKFVLR